MLVAQDAPAVNIVARVGDGWGLSTEADGGVEVAALGVRLALADLYDGVAFPDVPLHPGERL